MSEFGKTAAATGSRPAPRSRSPSRLSQLCRRPSLPWLPGHEEGIMYFDSLLNADWAHDRATPQPTADLDILSPIACDPSIISTFTGHWPLATGALLARLKDSRWRSCMLD
ncbi:hypothetical protein SNOG_12090 [Parastagonospora nodorum SN15]|uniref:Uncharacterized protein n=1 Tax=Phaeosphaeria nodorum (strain SN15 / ATCC MYA-4574 / FGSC 10173) TaxID=321614 RepID=Q0U824_PHANO|nr:hypothetical protein SNOG_12090 [Parastagonospora nodorum SN15]EAT80502.1 hypothetical protein SNOG_12090 [Parastagonospora nodorum SN15]